MAKKWFWPIWWPWPWPFPIRAEAELKDGHFGFSLKSIGRYLKILWPKNDFDLFGDLDLDLDPMTSKMKWSHPSTIAQIWWKFHEIPFSRFPSILLTNKQRNKETKKQRNKETKKQRNKPNQKQYLFRLSSGRGKKQTQTQTQTTTKKKKTTATTTMKWQLSCILLQNLLFFLCPIHFVAFQHRILPTTDGKAFNTRQQAKSCGMRQDIRQHVATCRMPHSRMLHVAFCWTGWNTLSLCDNVACHMLPKCCLGGIPP